MNILDRIVADTKELLNRRRQHTPLQALIARPLYSAPRRSFLNALQSNSVSFITEIKKASPSRGVIRDDFDPPRIAQEYTRGGAQAISVLTEPLHFQGSLDYLTCARNSTELPLLRKDFIFDSYQLHEARAYGADAVLLIAAILDKEHLFDLHQEAQELELDCLVELYEKRELDRVDLDQVRILGVNNRDLRTFEVDLSHSVSIFEQFPSGLVRVSESGIYTVEDVCYLLNHGTDAVLIGESLMRTPDPGEKLKSLIEGLHSTVKPIPNDKGV